MLVGATRGIFRKKFFLLICICTNLDVFLLKFAGIGHGLREGLVLVVAACESAENLTPSFRRCFTHELAVGMPDEDQRLAILHHYLGRRERDTTVQFRTFVSGTSR